MAYSGPQTTGASSPTVLSVLKTIFEQGVAYDVNVSSPAFAALSREGTSKLVNAKTHKFAIKGNIGQTARTYGANDPCAGFAVCSAPPEYCDVELTYKKIYIPYRVCNETIQEAGSGGAMFDVYRQDLKDLVEQHVHHLERSLFTGDGRDVLFTLADGGTDNGDGTWTYAVQWYGGLNGEELGTILESLLLVNMAVNVADQCGPSGTATLRTTTDDDNAAWIVSVDPTLGAETVTFDRTITGGVAGDVVYRSRQDTGGYQGCTDGLTGFPLLIDDFTLADPFQGVASEDCPSFASRICDNGGVKRDLTEELLEQAIATALVRSGRMRGEKVTFQRHAFFAHEATARRFALSLTQDRQFTAPMITRKGMKPIGGIDMEFLCYDGIPFITSHLGLRNRIFLADMSELVIVHNGKAEGQFLQAPRGDVVERVACTPTFEYVWFAYLDFATRKRNGMVAISDLNSFADC